MKYIWQQRAWPALKWDAAAIATALSDAVFCQGRFLGKLSEIGFDVQSTVGFETLSAEIVNSAAIEGETLNRDDVRSSVARRMELVVKGLQSAPSHEVDARVEMMMDATRGWERPMTAKRLKAWHAALFPTGYSGLVRVRTGVFRNDAEGPMRVVSRYGSLERVHFEAPPASRLGDEVSSFLKWLGKGDAAMPPLVKVAVAHLRFLTLHPFDDGNGRIARALTEYLLARMERNGLRLYSLSSQIQKEKASYYEELEHAQRNTLDVTRWVMWFMGLYARAIAASEASLEMILAKARFWRRHAQNDFNPHQREMLNRLLDGFTGNLTSSKWAKICKVSQDTASREIRALMEDGVLEQVGAGRSTHYRIVHSDKCKETSVS